MLTQLYAIALALLACHYLQEAISGHHPRHARASLLAATLAYALTYAKVALGE